MNAFAAQIEHRPVDSLRADPRNARTHSKAQIGQIAASIAEFGFTNPILISDEDMIVAGHGRYLAAKLLELRTVPTIKLAHLTAAQRRALVVADNKIALNSGWDFELLAEELEAISATELDLTLTGFSIAEADLIIDDAAERDAGARASRDDETPDLAAAAVARSGEIWQLGRHRLLCGDARDEDGLDDLLEGRLVDMHFADPPYNVRIDRNVCGNGSVRHREFAMASGEMSRAEFVAFLSDLLKPAVERSRPGAISYLCIDWRHMGELQEACEPLFSELKNVCVWNKTNGGMGTFYRSKHELIFVYKIGNAPHVNNFGLGDGGRYRTNVWDYPGISSIGRSRDSELAMHPTCKPVALVADAMRDCSRRGSIVLDVCAGSGTTLIAAEKTGRVARLIELDPLYCDVILRRYIGHTGRQPVLAATGATFEAVELERSSSPGSVAA